MQIVLLTMITCWTNEKFFWHCDNFFQISGAIIYCYRRSVLDGQFNLCTLAHVLGVSCALGLYII